MPLTTMDAPQDEASSTLPEFDWVAIPATEAFMMGLSADDQNRIASESKWFDCELLQYESPASTVSTKAFWMSRFPVTNKHLVLFLKNPEYYNDPQWWTEAGNKWRDSNRPYRNADPFDLPNNPAVFVTWYEALAYTKWLSAQLCFPVRVPTELEWEVAVSLNPVTGEKQLSLNTDADDIVCNCLELGFHYPSAVNLFLENASPLGVCEVLGNVWEWCSTAWQRDWTDSTSVFTYPYQNDDGREEMEYPRAKRVLRGGCYLDKAGQLRTTIRRGAAASVRLGGIGFRLVTDRNPNGN